jgi:NitT/TauT family transport system substrate-binding protein
MPMTIGQGSTAVRFTRRTALLAPFALGAPVVRAQTRESVVIMTPFAFGPNFLEMVNAQTGGHFARMGLDVRLLSANGTAQGLQQVTSGQAFLTRASALDVIQAVARTDAPLVAVATPQQGGTFHVISPADRPVTRALDLAGKTVGIVSVGGSTGIFLDLMLRKVGLQPDGTRREVTGDNPGAIELVRQGRIDCFMASIIAPIALRRRGVAIEAWSTDRYAPMPGQCYVVSRDTVASRGPVLTRVLSALRDSMREIMVTPARTILERALREVEMPGARDIEAAILISETIVRELWLARGADQLLLNVPQLWTEAFSAIAAAGLPLPRDPNALWTNSAIAPVMRL